jgi:hypothetical protein
LRNVAYLSGCIYQALEIFAIVGLPKSRNRHDRSDREQAKGFSMGTEAEWMNVYTLSCEAPQPMRFLGRPSFRLSDLERPLHWMFNFAWLVNIGGLALVWTSGVTSWSHQPHDGLTCSESNEA